MDRQCEKCSEKESCREVFKKLGSLKGPSVLLKVIQAFLLPLILFVAALAAAEKALAGKFAGATARDIAALAAGAFAVFLYLAILKLWRRKN